MNVNNQQKTALIKAAKQASHYGYAPYSKFRVGAALLTKSGKIITGCNIENRSYGLTICAERVAVFKAISEGAMGFTAIAIYTKTKDFTLPCGGCLQVLSEFTKNLKIITINQYDELRIYQLKKLLPYPFESQ